MLQQSFYRWVSCAICSSSYFRGLHSSRWKGQQHNKNCCISTMAVIGCIHITSMMMMSICFLDFFQIRHLSSNRRRIQRNWLRAMQIHQLIRQSSVGIHHLPIVSRISPTAIWFPIISNHSRSFQDNTHVVLGIQSIASPSSAAELQSITIFKLESTGFSNIIQREHESKSIAQ